MQSIEKIFKDYEKKSERRFSDFEVVKIKSLSNIQNDVHLKDPIWLELDEEVCCLGIDLEGSTIHSFKRKGKTMAKIYDYFTQNLVDFMHNIPEIQADYIDIKGDGAFGIYKGTKSISRAFIAGEIFKSFFS